MKNRPIFLVLLMMGLLVVYESSWAGNLTIEDRAKLGEVYSLERLKKYSQAMPTITDLYRRYPDDAQVKWTYARILGFGGRWKEAAVIFDELCAQRCGTDELLSYAHVLESQGTNAETLPYMKKLADAHQDQAEIQSIYVDMLSWNKQGQFAPLPAGAVKISPEVVTQTLIAEHKFGRALAQLDAVLKTSPDNESALLSKARLLSWSGRLDASVHVYKKLIKDHPDKVLYYREAARVLGWSGRVGEASSLYSQARRRFPDNPALKAEAMAKIAYYNVSST